MGAIVFKGVNGALLYINAPVLRPFATHPESASKFMQELNVICVTFCSLCVIKLYSWRYKIVNCM